MCDQSKTIATSFMCGKDLDNYLRNPYYAGPFTQGTRMLNKYRTNSTNPCIDHYENLQFEGCSNAMKSCKKQNKKPSCIKPPQSKPTCCPIPSQSPSTCSSDCEITPCSCCPPPKPMPIQEETCPNCNGNEDNNPITRRCQQLYNRGKSFLAQIERTTLPKIVVDDDEYLPSIMGCGWQIAKVPKILGKSKFMVKAYDPYLMLHSWQAMQGIKRTNEKNLRGGANNSDKSTSKTESSESDESTEDSDQKEEEEEEET